MMLNKRLLKVAGVVAAAGMGAGAGGQTVQVNPLILAGDFFPSGVVVTGFAAANNFAINNSGNWLIETDIGINAVITGSGTTVGMELMKEGDAVASPAGATISSFDSITINASGNSSFNINYANAPTLSLNSGVHYNLTQIIVESDIATAPQFSAGTPYIGWFETAINDANQILMLVSIDDPAINSTTDRALVRIDDPAGAATQTVLLKEGDEFPVGSGRFLADVVTSSQHFIAFTNGSRVATIFDLDGATTDDTGVALYDGTNWTIAAREGDPSPYSGRLFSSFSSAEVDLNNSGEWVVSADLDGASTDDGVILKNGTVEVAREGSPVHGMPSFNFASGTFSSGGVRIDDSGRVFYYATWNDPDTTRNSGIFRDGQLLVQKGVTMVPTNTGMELLTDISGITDNLTISPDGRYVIFEGVITEPLGQTTRRGSFLITIGTSCIGDFNNSGAVTVQDIFDFLAAYFANDSSADVNNSGGVTVQDIFDFLAAYFAGCP